MKKILIFRLRKFPKRFSVKSTVAYISFSFRDKPISEAWQEKREHGIKIESAIAFTRKKKSLNKKHEKHFQTWWMLHNIIVLYAPDDKGKNCSCFHEFRQITCPLNKHRQNKLNFGRFLIFKFLKFISKTTVFPIIVMLKLTMVMK